MIFAFPKHFTFFILGTVLFLVSCTDAIRRPSGASQMNSGFAHKGIVNGCANCHDLGKAFDRFPGATHPARNGQDCSACHSIQSWKQGTFSHTPTPTQCTTCHGAGGANDIFPKQVINEMSHGDTWLPECASCHAANAGIKWSGAVFDHSISPPTCSECHTAQRPTGPVGSPPFDHANSGGTGDCVGCHASIPANTGKVWSTGAFTHSPVPTTCANCHASDAAYTNIQSTVKNQMNHSFPGLSDCASCHKSAAISANFSASTGAANGWYLEALSAAANPTLATKGPYHAGVSGTPASCNACHSVDMPVGPVGNSPTFDHSAVDLSTNDCLGCHGNGAGLTWAGAAAGHTSTQTSCFSCHGPSNTTTAALMDAAPGYQMAHSYATVNSGTPDCYACHGQANTFTSWAFTNRIANTTNPPVLTAKGAFHASLSAQPVSCTLCHTSELPATTVPNTADGFNHAARYGTECASCHNNIPNNVGISWKAPFFNHMNNSASALGTCSPCHDTKQHHAGELCTSCHKNPSYPIAAPATTKGWSGGSFGDGGN